MAVTFNGAIIEQGGADQVYADPQHEYTRRLLAAVPQPNPDRS
jgi:peptide/nickel transport system ATP-binding protein